MSMVKLCDFCRESLPGEGSEVIVVSGHELDICLICFTSSVILSECRRVKARKPKPAKKRRTVKAQEEVANGTPNL